MRERREGFRSSQLDLFAWRERDDNSAETVGHGGRVGPENSRQLIMLKKLVYRAMLQTYELCVFFHDHFPDGRVPLPTVPSA